MKEIIVLSRFVFLFAFAVLLACNASAQEHHLTLKKGEGKRYTVIFHDGKAAEYLIYLVDRKTDTVFVECQVKLMDGITQTRFWQQYEWKIVSNDKVQLVGGHVFSPEMQTPQSFFAKDFSEEMGIPLSQSLFLAFTPFELIKKRLKKDFDLFYKDDVTNRPAIINPSKARPLDEKTRELINNNYSCL